MNTRHIARQKELADRMRPYLARPVVLTGLMGAGKSRIGRLLAEHLELPFADSDREIEAAAGRTIPEIFAEFGEAAFRDAERKIVERLLREGGARVIALGGGALTNPDTLALVKAGAVSLWLKAEPSVLAERTAGDTGRPLLAKGDPEKILAGLAQERAPVYAQADITVESEDAPLGTTLIKVLESLNDYLDTH